MTGKELLEKLSEMSEETLKEDIKVLLCDTKYPTGDGDYDNAYYEYERIIECSSDGTNIVIFGYV